MFRKKSVWLYLLPGLVGLLAFYLVPFVWGIWFSLTDGTIDNRFVGFDNYLRVWQNEVFQLGLKNTIELSLLCAPVIFVLSFLLAGMLRKPIAGSTFYRNALLMPYLMPSAAMLIIWLILFDYGGPINRLVAALGFDRVFWLEGAALRVPIVLLYIWKNLGFSAVSYTHLVSHANTAGGIAAHRVIRRQVRQRGDRVLFGIEEAVLRRLGQVHLGGSGIEGRNIIHQRHEGTIAHRREAQEVFAGKVDVYKRQPWKSSPLPWSAAPAA